MAGKTVVNQVQLGDSNTATNNFVLQTNVDGTAKLARGNAGATTQDVMTVDAAGKVAFHQNAQTWQDVTGSRAAATTYTNSTGQPIKISLKCVGPVNAQINMDISVGALTVSRFLFQPTTGNSGAGTCYAEVPAGSTYQYNWVNATATILELR